MPRPRIPATLTFAVLAALAGCAKEETRIPETIPPLPGKSTFQGVPQPPQPPAPPKR